jgi:FGGY-family pentulose kinase
VSDRAYLGIDVGTGSARAALFSSTGARLGMGAQAIATWRPEPDFVEQSSEDIWRACGEAVRLALREAGATPDGVAGIGFDATCSLVAVDGAGAPVTVSPTGKDAQNVIVWMDHRAVDQAARINAGDHGVLTYVGGTMSPEMQSPKLLWLAEHLPGTWQRAQRFFDLPDWLVFRATGVDVRSLCTTVCKWTYLGHEGRWDEGFFRQVGLGDLVDEGFARIGTRVRPMGERAGALTAAAARELGLAPGIPVSVAIIDAHAGGVGVLGAAGGSLDGRLALVGGTSSCHMAVSPEPRFIPGVWGPYYSAMVPDMWLNEGGQSATGALIDHVVYTHARGPELAAEARQRGTTVYALLNDRLDALAKDQPFPASLTRDLHVLPDFHGNRSPRADPTLRGGISGLRLDDGVDALALLYLATIQAIAHGTRHIMDTLNASGYQIDTLVACGGDAKNPVFLREHADATGCRIVLPEEPEAVLLGAAILGAVAAGDQPDLPTAMGAMTGAAHTSEPTAGAVRAYHDAKHRVFHRMYEDQMAYRALMA